MNLLELQFTPYIALEPFDGHNQFLTLKYKASQQLGGDLDIQETMVISNNALADLHEGLIDLARAIKPHIREQQ